MEEQATGLLEAGGGDVGRELLKDAVGSPRQVLDLQVLVEEQAAHSYRGEETVSARWAPCLHGSLSSPPPPPPVV